MRDELIGAERQNIDPNDGLILGKRRSRRLTSPIVEIPTKRKKVDEQSSKDGISTDTIRKSPIRKSLRLSAKKSKRYSRKTDADETNTKSKGQKPSTVTRLRRRADSVKGGQSVLAILSALTRSKMDTKKAIMIVLTFLAVTNAGHQFNMKL
eukprot:535296_1